MPAHERGKEKGWRNGGEHVQLHDQCLLTRLKIVQSHRNKVGKDIRAELLLQPIAVKPERALKAIPGSVHTMRDEAQTAGTRLNMPNYASLRTEYSSLKWCKSSLQGRLYFKNQRRVLRSVSMRI